MYINPDMYAKMPLGVVLRRSPGVTRWAKWTWRAVAVLPGAGPADWRELRREGEVVEYHAATVMLELHGAEAEAYMAALSDNPPSVWVVMRPGDERPEVALATASAYHAQDYTDAGDEIVEKVPMPDGLIAWVRDFAVKYFREDDFKKRRRDKQRVDEVEDGIGDARIPQMADVYGTPARRKGRLH